MAIPIQVQVGNLPNGFCPTGNGAYQQMLNAFMQATLWTLPGNFNGVNFGPTKPGPDDTDKPWFRLNLDGTPDRWYWYFNGQWVSPHPILPGNGVSGPIILWDGALPDFTIFDGGNGNPVAYADGPMWEEVTKAQGRSPIHPGQYDVPHASHNYTVQEQTGQENHELILGEIPAHTHFRDQSGVFEGVQCQTPPAGGFQPGTLVGPGVQSGLFRDTGFAGGVGGTPDGSTPATTTPHNTVHPVYGVYLLRRTARVAYAV